MSESLTPWWDNLGKIRVEGEITNYWAEGGMSIRALQAGDGSLDSRPVIDMYASGVSIKEEHRTTFVEEAIAKIGQYASLKYVTHPIKSTAAKGWRWANTDFMIVMGIENNGEAFSLHVCSQNAEAVEELRVFFAEKIGKRVSSGKVFVITQTDGGHSLTSIGIGSVPFEPSNYSKDVVEGFKFIVNDLKSDSPTGRVVIMDGQPGTGKTYLVRALLAEVPDAMFVMVPPDMLSSLSGPSLVRLLLGTKSGSTCPIVLIMEDADSVITPRAADNMHSVSTILNFSDGIMGSLLDLRIVATTNAHITEVDKAILRPGRLSRRVEVDELSAPEARDVWKRLTGKTHEEAVVAVDGRKTLAEVYQIARNNGYVAPTAKRTVGFASNPYDNFMDGDDD